MFPWFVLIHLKIFDFFGFCTEYTEEANANKNQKQLRSIFIFCIHLLNFIVLCYFLYRFTQNPIIDFNAIAQVNDITKFIAINFLYIFVIVESILKRKSQRHFWKEYNNIQTQFNNNYIRWQNISFRFYYIKCFSHFVVVFSSELVMYAYIINHIGINQLYYIFAFSTWFSMHQFRMFYYMFYLELIIYQLKVIDHDIDDLYNRNRSESSKQMIFINCKRLKKIRQHYGLIYTMTELLNDIFGWSHAIAVLYCFLLMLNQFNELIWCIKTNAESNFGRVEQTIF